MITNQLFLQTIKQRILTLDKKQQIIVVVAILLVIATLIAWVWSQNKNDTVIMQPAAVNNPMKVAEALDVSEETAKDIVKAIEKATVKPPVMYWTVEAKDTKEAAKVVEKQIENKKAPPMPLADKTIVTPQETKVDVYRIDLDADWEMGIGYGNHKGDSYIPIEVQRNYSKHKAIAVEIHTDILMKEVKGYEVKHVWRF